MNYFYPPSIHETVVDYALKDGDTVLDIGGYHGEWTAVLLDRNKGIDCRVFIFEPVLEFCKVILARFSEHKNVTILNTALSDSTGRAKMTVLGEGSHIAESGAEIDTFDVVDFFNEYEISNVALASINVEGHEFKLLPRMIETGLIKNIEKLQVQFHAEYPNAVELRDQIRERLIKTHIEMYCYPFVWESWRRA